MGIVRAMGFLSKAILGTLKKLQSQYRTQSGTMTMSGMCIGPFATAAGCSVETVRFYEREGLLQAAPRSEGNYRIYGDEQLSRLRFIRRCRSLDMTHAEIRHLLVALDSPRSECGDVNRLLDDHIVHVERRLEELAALRRDLVDLRHQCAAIQPARDCGILQTLNDGVVKSIEPGAGHVRGVHGS